jgi:hypothetical protein
LDKTSVNLGTTVVDERLHQSITLRNNGALGTNYRLVKTSLLRSEQTKPQIADNPKDENSEVSLEKETSTVSDLVNKEYVEVFTIKSDEHGFLGPHSSVSFPIEFTAPVAGNFHEEYTIVFDQTHPEVYYFK